MSRIIANPKILGGKPVIRGTRIAVTLILDLMGSGMTPREIVSEYPHLSESDVLAAAHYAATVLDTERITFLKAS